MSEKPIYYATSHKLKRDSMIDRHIFIIGLIYFLVLYLIAFFSNLHYREKDDFLYVSRSQWRAIAVMWLPIIVVFMKR